MKLYQMILSLMFTLMFTLSFAPKIAAACDIAVTTQTMTIGPETGPSPLLLSTQAKPVLRDVVGERVALMQVSPAGLESVTNAWDRPLFLFRPVMPLREGNYEQYATETDSGSEASFTVLSTTPTVSLELPENLNAEVVVYESSSMGCGGSASSCDGVDFSKVAIVFGAQIPKHANYRLAISEPGGAWRYRLVEASDSTTPSDRDRLEILERFEAGACLKIARLSDDGELGPERDLGCVVPIHESYDSSGCRSLPASDKLLIFGVAGVAWIFGRLNLKQKRQKNLISG